MGNTAYRFFVSFFSVGLWVIILVNYLGWSGGYIDLSGGSWNNNAWQNSYFGFASVQLAIEDLNNVFGGNAFFGVNRFTYYLQQFLDTLVLHLPTALAGLTDGAVSFSDVITALIFFIEIWIQPLEIILYLGTLLIYVLWYAVGILAVFLKACSGQYNIPFVNMPSPTDYNIVQTIVHEVHFVFAPML